MKLFNKILIVLSLIMVTGCGPMSRFASYRPPKSDENYIIAIQLQSRIPATYSLSINETHVLDLVWSTLSYEVVATGTYSDRQVIMRGHFYPGPRTIIDVEIAGEKAAQFDFNF